MMRVSFSSTILAAALIAAGCSHAQVKPASVAENTVTNPAPAVTPKTDQAPSQTTASADDQAREALQKVLNELRNMSVFFAYDSSTLTPEGEQKLAEVGRILGAHPNLTIRIEGNCDERGTEDYNLSLGQQRAEEARKYITAMGANGQQVKTVSYGAERPKVQGHDESAWRQNRRDDIVIVN